MLEYLTCQTIFLAYRLTMYWNTLLRDLFVLKLLAFSVLIYCSAVVDPRLDRAELEKTKTMLIVVDGVRWNDLESAGLEGLKNMAKNGVRARYINPVYPSNSIANMYSIVTGLYPENHGMLFDELLDLESNPMLPFDLNRTWSWWGKSEPIWSEAEREDLQTAVHYFPGACHLPSPAPFLCTSHQHVGPTEEEVNEVMRNSLRDLEEDEVDLVVVYYDHVRNVGLSEGPHSPSYQKALQDFDRILEEFQKNITNAESKVNLVVASGHGLTSCDQLTRVDITPFKDQVQLQLGQGAFTFLQPKLKQETQLLKSLRAWKSSVGVRVFQRNQIPNKYHIKKHPRTPLILLQAKRGHYIMPLWSDWQNSSRKDSLPAGCYGFDPEEVTDMRTIFLARGPAFQRNYVSDPLWNTDHYNLLCHLLDIAPSPNNGSWDRMVKLLDEDDEDTDYDYDDEEDDDEDDDDDIDDLDTVEGERKEEADHLGPSLEEVHPKGDHNEDEETSGKDEKTVEQNVDESDVDEITASVNEDNNIEDDEKDEEDQDKRLYLEGVGASARNKTLEGNKGKEERKRVPQNENNRSSLLVCSWSLCLFLGFMWTNVR